MDGVLLNWEDHFHAYMRSHGHQRAYTNVKSYWQENNYPGLSQDEARKMVYHFNTSAWMMGIPAYSDAIHGVSTLTDLGYRFVAITAMGKDPYALEARKYNLEKLFGADTFIDVIATDMYDPHSKKKTLKEWYEPGRYWIEDKYENYKLGEDIGYNAILMDHSHNSSDIIKEKVQRVFTWNDMYKLII